MYHIERLWISLCLVLLVQVNRDRAAVVRRDISSHDDHAAKSRTVGPFHQLLDESLGLSLGWTLRHGRHDSILFALSISKKPDYKWLSFGFRKGDMDDIFLLWFGKHKHLRNKDCYLINKGTSPSIHPDKSQDYHLSKSSKNAKTFNVTFYRKINTHDEHDIEIKEGNITVVWANGHKLKLSETSSEFLKTRKQLKMVLIKPEFLAKPSATKEKKTKVSESHPANIPATTPATAPASVPASTPVKPSSSQKVVNCTVHIKNTWYEFLKVKENSVYYAIIGSAALLTGIIVLMVACCCQRRKVMVSPRQKVSFYKVDDYDEDEQVEFLREKK